MVIIFIAISVFMVHKNTVTKKQRIEIYREIYMHVMYVYYGQKLREKWTIERTNSTG